MAVPFNKYQGTGNDFIIIDNREHLFNPANVNLIRNLCDRRFGIGADGLILIGKDPELDFRMIYFNSDGFESTMCGNGGRCAADFAMRNGISGIRSVFGAADGQHEAVAENEIIKLSMNDVTETRQINGNYFINTGSPHYVIFTQGLKDFDVFGEGKKIREWESFAPGGTNVNFVEREDDSIFVRTFERGVENETLSCGTGVTASAIAAVLTGHIDNSPVKVRTKGGDLMVEFEIDKEKIISIRLCGPATFVFEGKVGL